MRKRIARFASPIAAAACFVLIVPATAQASTGVINVNPQNTGVLSEYINSQECIRISEYKDDAFACLRINLSGGTRHIYTFKSVKQTTDPWAKQWEQMVGTQSLLPGQDKVLGFKASAMAARTDGTVYAFDENSRKLFSFKDGTPTELAGNGQADVEPWSGEARSRGLGKIVDIKVGLNGTVYLLDQKDVRVYTPGVSADSPGRIASFSKAFPPTGANFVPRSLAVNPSGEAFIAWSSNSGGSLGKVNVDSPANGYVPLMTWGSNKLTPGEGRQIQDVSWPDDINGLEWGTGDLLYIAGKGNKGGVTAMATSGRTYSAAGQNYSNRPVEGANEYTKFGKSTLNAEFNPSAIAFSPTRGLIISTYNGKVLVTGPRLTETSNNAWAITPHFTSWSPTNNLLTVTKKFAGPGDFTISLPKGFTLGQSYLYDEAGTKLCWVQAIPRDGGSGGIDYNCTVASKTAPVGSWLLSINGETGALGGAFLVSPGAENYAQISARGTDPTSPRYDRHLSFSWIQGSVDPSPTSVSIVRDLPQSFAPGTRVKGSATVANYGYENTPSGGKLSGLVPPGATQVALTPGPKAQAASISCSGATCSFPNGLPGVKKTWNVNDGVVLTAAKFEIGVEFVVPIDYVYSRTSESTYENLDPTVFEAGSLKKAQPNLWLVDSSRGPIADIQAVQAESKNGHSQVVPKRPFKVSVPITNTGGGDFNFKTLGLNDHPRIDLNLPPGLTVSDGQVLQVDPQTKKVLQVDPQTKKATGTVVGGCKQEGQLLRCPLNDKFRFDSSVDGKKVADSAASAGRDADGIVLQATGTFAESAPLGTHTLEAKFFFTEGDKAANMAQGLVEVLDASLPIVRIDAYERADPRKVNTQDWIPASVLDLYPNETTEIQLRVDSLGTETIAKDSTFAVDVELPPGAVYDGFTAGTKLGTWALGGPSPKHPSGDAGKPFRGKVGFVGTVTDLDGLQPEESFPVLIVNVKQIDNRGVVKDLWLDAKMTTTAKVPGSERVETVTAPELRVKSVVTDAAPTTALIPTVSMAKNIIRGQQGTISVIVNNGADTRANTVALELELPSGLYPVAGGVRSNGDAWTSKSYQRDGNGPHIVELSVMGGMDKKQRSPEVLVTVGAVADIKDTSVNIGYRFKGADKNLAVMGTDVGEELVARVGPTQVLPATSVITKPGGAAVSEPTEITLDASTSKGGFLDQPLTYEWKQLCVDGDRDDDERKRCGRRTDPVVDWVKNELADVRKIPKPLVRITQINKDSELLFRVTVRSLDAVATAVQSVKVDTDDAEKFIAGDTSIRCRLLGQGLAVAPGASGPKDGMWEINLAAANKLKLSGSNCADAGAQLSFGGASILLNGGVEVRNVSGDVRQNEVKITGGDLFWNDQNLGGVSGSTLNYNGTTTMSATGNVNLNLGSNITGGSTKLEIAGNGVQLGKVSVSRARLDENTIIDLAGNLNKDGTYSLAITGFSGTMPVTGDPVAAASGSVVSATPGAAPDVNLSVSASQGTDVGVDTRVEKLVATYTKAGLAFTGELVTNIKPEPVRVALAAPVSKDTWTLAATTVGSNTEVAIAGGKIPVSAVSGKLILTRTQGDKWSAPDINVTLNLTSLKGADLTEKYTFEKQKTLILRIGSGGLTGTSIDMTQANFGIQGLRLNVVRNSDGTVGFTITGGLTLRHDGLGRVKTLGGNAVRVPITSTIGSMAFGRGAWSSKVDVATSTPVTNGAVQFSNIAAMIDSSDSGATRATAVLEIPKMKLAVPVVSSHESFPWWLNGTATWLDKDLWQGGGVMTFTGTGTPLYGAPVVVLRGSRPGRVAGPGVLDVTAINIKVERGDDDVNGQGFVAKAKFAGTFGADAFTADVDYLKNTIGISNLETKADKNAVRKALTAALGPELVTPGSDPDDPADKKTPTASAQPSPTATSAPPPPPPTATSPTPTATSGQGPEAPNGVVRSAAPYEAQPVTGSELGDDPFCVLWNLVNKKATSSATVAGFGIKVDDRVSVTGGTCGAAGASVKVNSGELSFGDITWSEAVAAVTKDTLQITAGKLTFPGDWKVTAVAINNIISIPLKSVTAKGLVCASGGGGGGEGSQLPFFNLDAKKAKFAIDFSVACTEAGIEPKLSASAELDGGGKISINGSTKPDGTFSAEVQVNDLVQVDKQKLNLSGRVARATPKDKISANVTGKIGSDSTELFRKGLVILKSISASLDLQRGIVAGAALEINTGGGNPLKIEVENVVTFVDRFIVLTTNVDLDATKLDFLRPLRESVLQTNQVGVKMVTRIGWSQGLTVDVDLDFTRNHDKWFPLPYIRADVTGLRMGKDESFTIVGAVHLIKPGKDTDDKTGVPLEAKMWFGKDGYPSKVVFAAGGAGSNPQDTINALIRAANFDKDEGQANIARAQFSEVVRSCDVKKSSKCVDELHDRLTKNGFNVNSDVGRRFTAVAGAIIGSYGSAAASNSVSAGSPIIPGGRATVLALAADIDIKIVNVKDAKGNNVKDAKGNEVKDHELSLNTVSGGVRLLVDTDPFKATFDAGITYNDKGVVAHLGFVPLGARGVEDVTAIYSSYETDVTTPAGVYRGLNGFGVMATFNAGEWKGLGNQLKRMFNFTGDATVKFPIQFSIEAESKTINGRASVGTSQPFDIVGSKNDYTSSNVALENAGLYLRKFDAGGWQVGIAADVIWRQAGDSAKEPGTTKKFSGELGHIDHPDFKGMVLNAKIGEMNNVFGVEGLRLTDTIFTLQVAESGTTGYAIGARSKMWLPKRWRDPIKMADRPIDMALVIGTTSCISASIGKKGDTTDKIIDLDPVVISAASFSLIGGSGSCIIGNQVMDKHSIAISGSFKGVGIAGAVSYRETVGPGGVAKFHMAMAVDVGAWSWGPIDFDDTKFNFEINTIINPSGGTSFDGKVHIEGGGGMGRCAQVWKGQGVLY